MKKIVYFLLVVLLYSCQKEKKYEKWIQYNQFINPSVHYRSIPFYSLNDLLDPKEIEQQLTEFKKGGYGGSYLHSRVGLLTEFLGKDWWLAMDSSVKKSEELGIEAWFYDEDKWPSGFAGGIIPKISEDYHARCLMRLDKSDTIPATGTLITEDKNFKYISYKMKMGNPWFNGTCWVDLLNPSTVSAFIDISYKPYAERYKEKFGNYIKGIFTDEPQLMPQTDHIKNRGNIPFSPVLMALFKKKYGYNLKDSIASLFDSIGNFEKIRLDYYRLLALSFEESFSKQIGTYCKENNMIFTGHYNGEEGLNSITRNVGNMMIQYRNMQMPGIDFLGMNIDRYLNTGRSLSSVANQYGIKRRLSETFGISGQNMSFEDRKWITDWHTEMGINHICPHLVLYSLKGVRKRDYPPTFSPHQPYWKFNKIIEDYIGRLCYINTVGKYDPEFLVIHPLESNYIESGCKADWVVPRDKKFQHVLEQLQNSHRDYDLGDEQILSEIGIVKNGKIILNEMSYKAIILPYMITIRKSTLELIKQFKKQGGCIFIVGEKPLFVDGKKDSIQLNELIKSSQFITNDLFPEIPNTTIKPHVIIEGSNNEMIWSHRRKSGNGFIVQLSNKSRIESIKCKIYLSGNNDKLVLWDPSTTKCYSLKKEEDGSIRLFFNPTQSYVISSGIASKEAQICGQYKTPGTISPYLKLEGEWIGKRKDPNIITLDFASYSIDNGKKISKSEPVLGIHNRLTNLGYNGPLQLKYEFDIKTIPINCSLIVEQSLMYQSIKVNGNNVIFNEKDFYKDKSFDLTSITKYLKKGKNNVELNIQYISPIGTSFKASERYGTEIESIYLLGDFGVEATSQLPDLLLSERNLSGLFPYKPVHRFKTFSLTNEKTTFLGDLTLNGYPFYNGDFELHKKFLITSIDKTKRYYLTFPLHESIVISVKLNDKIYTPICWNPWEIDITDELLEGSNKLTITLTNSLRNLLGPHHHVSGELINLSPLSFTGKTSWTCPLKGQEDWYDVRLTKECNIWRDEYHIIPFGLLESPIIIKR